MTTRISERLVRLESTLERVERFLDKHEKAMLGNGTPGCIVRMDRLEKTAELNFTNIGKIFRSLSKIQKTIWIAMGGGIMITYVLSNHQAFASILKLIEGK